MTSFGRRVLRMLPRALRVTRAELKTIAETDRAVEAARRGFLVADDVHVRRHRRRASCPRLGTCEDAWIREHGEAQARCPDICQAGGALAAPPVVQLRRGGRAA